MEREREAAGAANLAAGNPFRARFVALFDAHADRVYRVLARISGDEDLASDLVQEAFLRLYRRGELPDRPEAWLISVALNLFRNARATRRRRRLRLGDGRARESHGDAAADPEEVVAARETRDRVRRVLERLPPRDRQLLLLRAEGYRYRDIARALDVAETSVGTLLARARRAFRTAYDEATHAR